MKMIKNTFLMAGAAAIAMTAGMAAAQDAYPPLAPLGDPPIPLDNQMSDAKVELGKILFWDPDRKSVV